MKYFAIEYLRVWFLFLIIVGHTKMADAFAHVFGDKLIFSMGSRVDIFMLICGFFLYKTLQKNKDKSFWEITKKRMKRILPALIPDKLVCVVFLGDSADYLLSNLFMLNKNIGISVSTLSHIVWYVDVMFWTYMLYAAVLSLFEKRRALLLIAVTMFVSLMILFTNSNVNLHFQMATAWLDGGLLRGLAFVGMGVLLAAIPKSISYVPTKRQCYIFSVLEIVALIASLLYPIFVPHTSSMVLNHVLWTAVFCLLFTYEYGYVSRFVNRQDKIKVVSAYAYEIYVFQWFAILLGQKWLSPNSHPFLTIFGVLILSYVFGRLFKDYVEPLMKKIWKTNKVLIKQSDVTGL